MLYATSYFLLLSSVILISQFVAAEELDKSAYVARATSKFVHFPGIPLCKGAVQSGDPTKEEALERMVRE